MPWKATRFCGVRVRFNDPENATLVSYWTPKFFQALPLKDNLTLSEYALKQRGERIHNFKFLGLEDFIKRYCYTEVHERYSGSVLDKLLTSKVNTTIYKMRSGQFGFAGGEYEPIDIKLAYDILFRKLAYTTQNITEDVANIYELYKYRLPAWRTQRDYIQSQIDGCIRRSYRPVYPREVARWFQGDPQIRPYLETIGGILYIKSDVDIDCEENLEDCKDFTRVVTNLLRSAATAGKYQIVRIPDYNIYGYGVLGREYIPLSYQSSYFLDYLGLAVTNAYEPVTLNEIVEILDIPIWKKLKSARDNWVIKELIPKGLAASETKRTNIGGVPHQENTYHLTDIGFAYVHRHGEIKTPMVFGT